MENIFQTQNNPGQNSGRRGNFSFSSLISGFVGGVLAVGLIANQPALQSFFGQKQSGGSQESSVHKVSLSEESGVIDVVKKAGPAVVSIVATKDVSKFQQYSWDPFSDDFFSPFFGYPKNTQPKSLKPNIQEVGAGSGFLVSEDGIVLTNKHVVSDSQASYTVITEDGKKYEAKVLTTDPRNDIALVKIEAKGMHFLELSDSEKIQIGQKVVAIGNSLGQYKNTVTSGIISGVGRSITAGGQDGSETLTGVIQTDAAINPGNSGGPLLNLLGQVVGINTAIDRQGQLVGFAIPSNDAKKALDSFKKNGKISRPYIGVRYIMITSELAKEQNLPKEYGALIVRGDTYKDFAVLPGSPADKAGLVENDIVLEVDGKKVEGTDTLAELLKNREAGDSISLKVYHRGQEKTMTIKLEEAK